MKHTRMTLAIVAAVVVAFGFINFFASLAQPTPIPLVLSHPLAMLAMAYLLFQVVFPRMLHPSSPGHASEAVQQLSRTGAELATCLCGGRIGLLEFRGPLIRVSVFPGGLLIKPVLMRAVPLFREEITTIEERRYLLTSIVELTHTSKSIRSPILLAVGKRSKVGAALLLLKNPS